MIRRAKFSDATAAVSLIRNSIIHLNSLDHHNDELTIDLWLANKTVDNMHRWIAEYDVIVDAEGDKLRGLVAVANETVILNYVSPDARFQGVSKALMERLEMEYNPSDFSSMIWLKSTITALRFYSVNGWIVSGPVIPGFGLTVQIPMQKTIY